MDIPRKGRLSSALPFLKLAKNWHLFWSKPPGMERFESDDAMDKCLSLSHRSGKDLRWM
jgi:hypothetical protein